MAAEGKRPDEIKVEVTLPEMSKIISEYADSGYWKMRMNDDDIDQLLNDYQ